MNVFILDRDMEKSAQMLDDAHLKSQINEACQILMANWNYEYCKDFAKIGHLHHPVTIYYSSMKKIEELLSYLFVLANEYYFRFGKEHQNYFWMIGFTHENPQYFCNLSKFSISKTHVNGVMTDNIEEIRNYIMTKPMKKKPTWTNREKPDWWVV